jgi:hypothetical protein
MAATLTPTTTAVSLDAEPHFNDFLLAHGRIEAIAQSKPVLSNMTMTSLPSVSVYSPTGELIYEGGGDRRENNFAIMRGMPGTVEHLQPLGARPKLAAILEIVPEFKAREQTILSNHHYVVLAVVFPQGQVSRTEKELHSLRDREGTVPIDTLLVRLQP